MNPSAATLADAPKRTLFSSLFWRTFVLLALLLAVSLATWFQSLRVFERVPRVQQIASQIVSVVKLTRAALLYSDPDLRRQLLQDLVHNEGIKVYPRERDDTFSMAGADRNFNADIQNEIRDQLGPATILATQVNGIPAIWVSFQIDGDDYWVAISRDRFERIAGLQWLWWGISALSLSLLGAAFITALVNRPLTRLARAARDIGSGRPAPLLPEQGTREVIEANTAFNQMAADLERLEADRAVMLAGISHDLRTPLARLRLEVELCPADAATRDAMAADIEQMNHIVGQFLDYAKPASAKREAVDVDDVVAGQIRQFANLDDIAIAPPARSGAHALCDPAELRRMLDNLLENARRYGGSADGEGRMRTEVEIVVGETAGPSGRLVTIAVGDHGAGVPEDDLPRMTRPFVRLDTARTSAQGTGLGLTMVQRTAERMGGTLRLSNRPAPGSGLIATLVLPAA